MSTAIKITGRELNSRESWAALAVIRHRLGLIGFPSGQLRWASDQRPDDARLAEPQWIPADDEYRNQSRIRIVKAADAYIEAIKAT